MRANDVRKQRAPGRPERTTRAVHAYHRTMFVALAAVMMASCTYYQPVPVQQPGPSKFDRSWEAAHAAAEDVGVTITEVDRERGMIRGYKNTADVTITLWQEADGSVRVGFNARAPSGPDSGLANTLSQAYHRRMGR